MGLLPNYNNPVVFAIVVVCLHVGQPLIRDLLERGRFSPDDTRVVAVALVMLCGMIIGGSLGEVAAKVFFSRQHARTPVLVGLIGFGIGIALKFAWVRSWGIVGIAAATSVFYLLNAFALLGLAACQLGFGIFRGIPGTLLRTVSGTAAAVGLGQVVVLRTSLEYSSLWGASAGGIALFAVLLLLRDEVAWRAIRVLLPARTQEPPP